MLEIRLFAQFREGRKKISYLDPKDFPTPKAILDHLGIEENEVAILLVNGFHQTMDTPLQDEDVIAIFPPVAGG